MATTSGWELFVRSSLSLVMSVAKWSGYETLMIHEQCCCNIHFPLFLVQRKREQQTPACTFINDGVNA